MGKSYQAQSKRSKEVKPRTTAPVGYSHRNLDNTHSGSRVQATSMESVGNPKNKPECPSWGAKARPRGSAFATSAKRALKDAFLADVAQSAPSWTRFPSSSPENALAWTRFRGKWPFPVNNYFLGPFP